jgi:hypothetical protein
MALARKSAERIGLAALALALGCVVFTRINCFGFDSLWAVLADLLVFGPSLIGGVACASTSKPLRAIGAAGGLILATGFAYYSECVRPYEGGGASFIGLALLVVVPACTLVGVFVFELIDLVFQAAYRRVAARHAR